MKKYGDILNDVRTERICSAVETAAGLYLKKGIDAVTMTDIADECKIGVASLYRYFGTKQQFTVKTAVYIWRQKTVLFETVYNSESYHSKSGLEQIEELLKVFYVLYKEHKDFLRFISAFDAFIQRESIDVQALAEYNAAVTDIMDIMLRAAQKGAEDGSIRKDVDIRSYYFTVTHSLLSLCRKLAEGALIESDEITDGDKEIMLAIDMYIKYITA